MIAVGIGLAAVGARALQLRGRESRYGDLVAADVGGRTSPILRSQRYAMAGRPDEVRRLRGGRQVPVELKSRAAPPRGPPRSHRVQVAAYCLLIEEATGAPPPYGVLRYSDGSEFRLSWNASTRAELLELRAEVARPYDGRATPSVAKCTACRWRTGCDARAV